MKKAVYVAPVVKSETIQIGVFGAYGGGNGGGHHHGPRILPRRPWHRHHH